VTLDPRTPVLVGAGLVDQRIDMPDRARDAFEAIDLMQQAIEAAADDAGGRSLLADVRWIAVPAGMWSYRDPARLLAERIGATSAHGVLAEVGILQQELLDRACDAIARGDLDVAVVVGGEAKYRAQQLGRAGIDAPDVDDSGSVPDETLVAEHIGVADVEITRNFVSPVSVFAAIDSAIRADQGWTIDEHRAHLGRLWERFGRVAAGNPRAWDRSAPSAEAIITPGPGNRMVAFPYTRLLASQWNVDQAAAYVLCSADAARRHGVPDDRWVFPQVSTVSNHAVPAAQRVAIHRSPGAAAAGRSLFETANVGVDDIAHVDLYSCFPAAVQIYARELGIGLDRQLTVTGGMTFAGGPFNNYVLQALGRLVELLRSDPGSLGLSSSVSGPLVKQGFGLWSTQPPVGGFRSVDVTAAVAARDEPRPLVDDLTDPTHVVAYTVDEPLRGVQRLVAVVEDPTGARTIGQSLDTTLIEQASTHEWVGRAVGVEAGELRAG
jgi:acetyl-CoA C-acetyltransferase